MGSLKVSKWRGQRNGKGGEANREDDTQREKEVERESGGGTVRGGEEGEREAGREGRGDRGGALTTGNSLISTQAAEPVTIPAIITAVNNNIC